LIPNYSIAKYYRVYIIRCDCNYKQSIPIALVFFCGQEITITFATPGGEVNATETGMTTATSGNEISSSGP
jgi:hypothetical protein